MLAFPAWVFELFMLNCPFVSNKKIKMVTFHLMVFDISVYNLGVLLIFAYKILLMVAYISKLYPISLLYEVEW